MKRILIFSLSYYPEFVGGAEIALKEITDRISPNEISFTMITLRYSPSMLEEEKIGNVLVHRVGGGSRKITAAQSYKISFYLHKIIFIILATRKALKLHKELPFNGLWAMMSYMVFPVVLMRFLGINIPYAITLQEGDTFERVFKRFQILPFMPMLKSGFRNADALQVISTFLGLWGQKLGFQGYPEVIPNGVEVESFSRSYSDEELVDLRKTIQKKEGDIFLITTSRLVEKNAVDDIIKSLALLPDYIKLFVLGVGPNEKKLKQLAHALGVDSRVRFFGYIDHKELPKYLKISDIFIRPSLSEGMGNSFVEAMASGIPVIGTQEGGLADFLFDPERNPTYPPTGRAVIPRDPRGIAEAVEKYIRDTETATIIVKNAKETVIKRFDWNLIASQMKAKVLLPILKEKLVL